MLKGTTKTLWEIDKLKERVGYWESERSESLRENRNVPKTWKEILDNNETRRNQTLER